MRLKGGGGLAEGGVGLRLNGDGGLARGWARSAAGCASERLRWAVSVGDGGLLSCGGGGGEVTGDSEAGGGTEAAAAAPGEAAAMARAASARKAGARAIAMAATGCKRPQLGSQDCCEFDR